MADIRKRDQKKPYQVRYLDSSTKSGYGYRSFARWKDANIFKCEKDLEEGGAPVSMGIQGVHHAVDEWLRVCEKEGTDGNDPVTPYTLKNYEYIAKFMRAYDWPKTIQQLQTPDIVEFRSWLLQNAPSRFVARRTLSLFQTVLREMALRGHVSANAATGVSINSQSRYDEPVTPPTQKEFQALLAAADRLANSKNAQIAKSWERYRPMVYLAGDTGMRPGEYLALPKSNLKENEVKVDRAVERSGLKISVTKTPAGRRWIDLSPETSEMVHHYAETVAAPSKHDLVFPSASGRWQCVNNWRNRAFSALCLEAGLVEEVSKSGKTVEKPKFSPYDLRHFYASMLIERRVNLKRIQKLMGHTNITTTLNIYGHLIERAEDIDTGGTKGLIASITSDACGDTVATTE